MSDTMAMPSPKMGRTKASMRLVKSMQSEIIDLKDRVAFLESAIKELQKAKPETKKKEVKDA